MTAVRVPDRGVPVLALFVISGFAMFLTGCGGSGSPRGVPRPGLLVKLGWYNDSLWGSAGSTSLVVEDPPGVCHVEQYWSESGPEPVGKFEMELTPAQLKELYATVEEAIRGLKAGYPPPPKDPPDPGWPITGGFYLSLTCGKAHAAIGSASGYFEIPEPARSLCWWGQPRGLLDELLEATLEHPLSAIGLSVASDKASYGVADPIQLTLTVRSVGREPVAFPSMDCRELVDGLITVTGQLPNGQQVLAESFPFGSSEPPKWAPFTPAARADLRRVRVLAPGEAYAFKLPPLTAPRPSGNLALNVGLRVSPRYHVDKLLDAVGAPMATGEWQDSLQVPVYQWRA